ncbi:unnamed protein product [Spirodela intermedia]|uniref:DUF1771 domain-containing protein n=1 Tax=Spirodela intermedia TaxID=51605 RepID=A0A7I8J256_SPIIN|nr:unnamed protein product [Spirodela intermedia]CAA6664217.1 unnamed protein product [Spirodela intermedia]
MSSSSKSFLSSGDARLTSPNKVTSLNPNAAEFVPSALRSLPANNKNVDVARMEVPGTSRKTVLHRSMSNVSNHSDDEAYQFWHCQLPDDITPDFNVMGEEDFQAHSDLSHADLSINDGVKPPIFSMTNDSHILGKQLEISPQGSEQKSLKEKTDYAGRPAIEDYSSTPLLHSRTNNLDKQFMNDSWHLTNCRDGGQYSGDPGAGFRKGLLNEHGASENMTVEHVEFLSSQFPDFALESLAEVYYANGCDLNSTIEMLSQLELKVDVGFSPNMGSKASSAPSLNDLNIHSVPDNVNRLPKHGGKELQQAKDAFRFVDKEGFSLFKSPFSGEPLGTRDFVPSFHKTRSQDSEDWKYERDGSTDARISLIRNSQILTSSYNVPGRLSLETTQMYSDMREEAQDIARLRNAFYEQREKQAYLIGSKTLGKELGAKGQMYNIQMKEVQEKPREVMQQQRLGPKPLIDLHGLHVNEAIHVLKHELSILRRTAKSAGRRLQVMVCVGVEGPTRSPRPQMRLPVVVQQYLLHENLQFSEDQPGLLRVVIC